MKIRAFTVQTQACVSEHEDVQIKEDGISRGSQRGSFKRGSRKNSNSNTDVRGRSSYRKL